MTRTTESAAATRALGAQLGALLRPGDFIALRGDLGAGKTQFVQGIATGLAVPAAYHVTSPTYTVLNIYPGRLQLFHFDLYRLSGPDEVFELGFDDYFYGEGVSVVEWSERLAADCPEDHLSVDFTYDGDDRRTLTITPHGRRSVELFQQFVKGEKTFDPTADSC